MIVDILTSSTWTTCWSQLQCLASTLWVTKILPNVKSFLLHTWTHTYIHIHTYTHLKGTQACKLPTLCHICTLTQTRMCAYTWNILTTILDNLHTHFLPHTCLQYIMRTRACETIYIYIYAYTYCNSHKTCCLKHAQSTWDVSWRHPPIKKCLIRTCTQTQIDGQTHGFLSQRHQTQPLPMGLQSTSWWHSTFGSLRQWPGPSLAAFEYN